MPLKLLNALLLVCVLNVSALAALEWEKRVIEKNPSATDTRAEAVYPFVNRGEEPVTIEKVEPSCGCTTAQLSKRTYAPGEQGEIKVVFEFGSRTGRQVKTIEIATDAAEEPTTHLTLRVDIPELVRVHPRTLYWRAKEAGEPKAIDLRVMYEQPIHVRQVEERVAPKPSPRRRDEASQKSDKSVTENQADEKREDRRSEPKKGRSEVRLKTVEKGRRYRITVTPPSEEKGIYRSVLRIRTDFPNQEPRTYHAYLRVLPPRPSHSANQ